MGSPLASGKTDWTLEATGLSFVHGLGFPMPRVGWPFPPQRWKQCNLSLLFWGNLGSWKPHSFPCISAQFGPPPSLGCTIILISAQGNSLLVSLLFLFHFFGFIYRCGETRWRNFDLFPYKETIRPCS